MSESHQAPSANDSEGVLVAAALAGSDQAFARLVERYRAQLQLHCYRMLGSLQDAEDVVQETFLRAWRRLSTFQGRSTFRTWLYRIATNACLDFLDRQQRRPRQPRQPGRPASGTAGAAEVPWLQPYPDRPLEQAAAEAAGPEAMAVSKETIELAFLIAIQHLPARQRAVLILRDVLGWPAAETATTLQVSVAAVKSALQRARATLREHLPRRREEWAAEAHPSDQERAVLRGYVARPRAGRCDRPGGVAGRGRPADDATPADLARRSRGDRRGGLGGRLHPRVRAVAAAADTRQPPAGGRLLPAAAGRHRVPGPLPSMSCEWRPAESPRSPPSGSSWCPPSAPGLVAVTASENPAAPPAAGGDSSCPDLPSEETKRQRLRRSQHAARRQDRRGLRRGRRRRGRVARAFAREGARVGLAGRTLATLDKVADDIRAAGGVAQTARVDALDQDAVDACVDATVARWGRIDVSFNAVTYGDIQGAPLIDLPTDRLIRPTANALRAQHLTARAAARSMVGPGSGVILTIIGHGPPTPNIGSTMVSWDAVQSLLRQFAAELGPKGIRVAWLRTAGFTESILEAPDYGSSYTPLAGQELLKELEAGTMLHRLPSLAEAGDLAAFLASDHARSITTTGVNITSGAVAD